MNIHTLLISMLLFTAAPVGAREDSELDIKREENTHQETMCKQHLKMLENAQRYGDRSAELEARYRLRECTNR